MFARRPIRSEILVLGLSLFFLLFCNLPFWHALIRFVEPADWHGWLFIGTAGVLVLAYYNLVLTLFALPGIFKPLATLLLMVTAGVSYFMNQYGVMIDEHMIQNVLETNTSESFDLLTVKLFVYLFLLGVLPSWFLWTTPIAWRRPLREAGVKLLSLVLSAVVFFAIAFLFYQQFASLFRNHREIRFIVTPSNYLQASWGYFNDHYLTRPTVVAPIGEDARKGARWNGRTRKALTVIVVGETARAENFGLNGYARDTTPQLAREAGVINLSNTWSCGTETAVSVPCMFSNLTRDGYSDSKARGQQGLLDVLQRAGFQVWWRDNQSGCKGACDRVPNDSTAELKNPALCENGECRDEIMLEGAQEWVDKLTRDGVLVLHQMGSHGPAYFQRYPAAFERFTPVCRTSQLDKCDRQSIINGYDNTILYTDQFLTSVIRFLKRNDKLDTSLIYMSDHGESLGEHGMYLHGAPYVIAPDQQKHIPAILWLSDSFSQSFGIDRRCLKQQSAAPRSHDNLFHSVLGLLDVNTRLYQRDLDLFAGCRQ